MSLFLLAMYISDNIVRTPGMNVNRTMSGTHPKPFEEATLPSLLVLLDMYLEAARIGEGMRRAVMIRVDNIVVGRKSVEPPCRSRLKLSHGHTFFRYDHVQRIPQAGCLNSMPSLNIYFRDINMSIIGSQYVPHSRFHLICFVQGSFTRFSPTAT